MKLQIGFSDEIDSGKQTGYEEHIKTDDGHHSWEYNLYEHSESKATVTWTMLDKPCVSAYRQTLENLQQSPHLNFIRCDKHPFKLVPDLHNFLIKNDTIGLLDPDIELQEYVEQDFVDVNWGRDFGELYLQIKDVDQNMKLNDESTHIMQAYTNPETADFDKIIPRNTLYVSPFLNLDLVLNTQERTIRNEGETKWLKENQTELESRGFDIQGINCWFDKFIKIGELDVTKTQLNKTVEQYNYITSMEWIDD